MRSRGKKSDLEIVREIDESEVDLPEGMADFVETCLRQVENGEPLTEAAWRKAMALLIYVRRNSSSD